MGGTDIKRVGILGSGIMGSGIAEVAAKSGFEVVLRSRQQNTADATLAMKALALGLPFKIRIGGRMDLQYVEDVAATFTHCLLSPLEGAHLFNLAGEVVHMEDLVQTLDRVRPGAARSITFSGPQVPVAYRMDATRLHTMVPGIPQTSLEEGMRRTLEIYDRLAAEGRLEPTGIPTP